MGNVSFEEETYQQRETRSQTPIGLTSLVVRMGLAKNEREAHTFLIWVAAIGCVFTLGLLISLFIGRPSALNEQDIERIIQLQQQ